MQKTLKIPGPCKMNATSFGRNLSGKLNLLTLLLAVVFTAGCFSNKLQRVEDLAPNEAGAVARIRIVYNGKDVTKGSEVVFNAPTFGFPKYAYALGEEKGYVFAKLPVGRNSIDVLVHKGGIVHHNFHPDELTFQLGEGKAVYYLGDMTLDWPGIKSGAPFPPQVLTGSATTMPMLVGGKLPRSTARSSTAPAAL